MKIVPTLVEEYVNRVPRQYRTWAGIGWAILAASCAIRLLFLVFAQIMLASVGWSPVSLIFSFMMWGVIGVVAVIGAVAFLTGATRPD
jgi:hypothetical protein